MRPFLKKGTLERQFKNVYIFCNCLYSYVNFFFHFYSLKLLLQTFHFSICRSSLYPSLKKILILLFNSTQWFKSDFPLSLFIYVFLFFFFRRILLFISFWIFFLASHQSENFASIIRIGNIYSQVFLKL